MEQRVPVIRRISGIRVILKRALQEPLRQIAANAGEEGAIVLGRVLESKDPNFGYNALTGEFEDLVKAGCSIRPSRAHRSHKCRIHRRTHAHHRSSCR